MFRVHCNGKKLVLLLLLGVFVWWPTLHPASAADKTAADKDTSPKPVPRQTVFLDGDFLALTPQRRHIHADEGTVGETLRQAVLIAARDELGCNTRDYWLGESVPDADSVFRFRLLYSVWTPNLSLTLQQHGPEVAKLNRRTQSISELSYGNLAFDLDAFRDRLEKVEVASRNELVDLLKKFGISGRPNPWHESAPVPAEITELLREPSFTSQFAAVRALHRLLRADGESPQRLAALVEGYLHLSYLSDCYFHPMREVFRIRAVLYAHRLTNKRKPFDRYARGIRFAALALAGFHKDASQTWQSRMNRNPAQPAWLDLAQPCLEYDFKALAKLSGDKTLSPWTKLYEFRAYQQADYRAKAAKLCGELIDEHPNCHALRGMPLMSPTSTYLPAQESACEHLGKHLYDQIETIPDLPKPVEKLVAAGQVLKNTKDHVKEHAVREQLFTLLVAADGCGSPLVDQDELSWQVLGAMARELTFSQVAWRTYYLGHDGPNPSREVSNKWLDDTSILTRKHRYLPLLGVYGDEAERNDTPNRIPKDPKEIKKYFYRMQGRDFVLWIFTMQLPQGDDIWRVISEKIVDNHNRGPNINAAYYNAVHARNIKYPKFDNSHGTDSIACSPFNPWTLFHKAKAGDPQSRAIIESRWDAYEDQPELQAALGLALYKHGEYAESVRRLEAVRARYPKPILYDTLAESYLKLGDHAAFYRTLNAYCELPDIDGNEKAALQLKTALELLADRKREAAMKKLALAAKHDSPEGKLARSFMLEMKGQFKEAASTLGSYQHSFGEQFLDWYWASLRAKTDGSTQPGKTQPPFHKLHAMQMRLPYEKPRVPHYMVMLMSVPPDVREAYKNRVQIYYPEPASSLFHMNRALRCSDEEYKKSGKKWFQSIAAKSRNPRVHSVVKGVAALAACFVHDMEDSTVGKLNTAQIEDLLAEANLADRAHLLFFIGAYHARHGLHDRAESYWKRAVTLPVVRNIGRNMAIHELRQRGMSDGEYLDLIDSWFVKSLDK